MADEIKQNTDIDLDTADLGAVPELMKPEEHPLPTSPKALGEEKVHDLGQELVELEQKYKAEISKEDELSEKIKELKTIKQKLESNIQMEETEIKQMLSDLHNLKDMIETKIKTVSELKKADIEIDQSIEEVNTLETSKQLIEEKIKTLETKLQNLK